MARLILVRHAMPVPPQPDDPADHLRPLSALGAQQALDLVPALTAYGAKRVLSSPYTRAVQTVEPTAAALGLQVELRDPIGEWRHGHRPPDDWVEHCHRAWADPNWSTPTGETHFAVTTRAVNALLAIAAEHSRDTVIIGTHGCWTSRALLWLGAPVDAAFWQSMPLPAIYEIRMDATSAQHIQGPGLGDWRSTA